MLGVSIVIFAGDNGILKHAEKAKEQTKIVSEKEQLYMKVVASIIESNGKILKSNLAKNLEVNEKDIIGDGPFYLKYKSERYKISADGEITTTGNAYEITSDNYGSTVEYNLPTNSEVDYSGGWQILYADEDNVYLISKDITEHYDFGSENVDLSVYDLENNFPSSLLNDSERFPATTKWLSAFKDNNGNWFNSNSNSMKSLLYMLDSKNVWNPKYKNDNADYVIGGPTIELLYESYNEKILKNSSEKLRANAVQKTSGNIIYVVYDVGQNGFSKDYSYWNAGKSYWLAATTIWHSGMGILYSADYTWGTDYNIATAGYDSEHTVTNFRPVVCLSSKNILTWNESESIYTLEIIN